MTSLREGLIKPDDGLGKHPKETARWHLSIIDDFENGRFVTDEDFCHTNYWKEYLIVRFDKEQSIRRCYRLLDLYNSMKTTGFDRNKSDPPVCVVDLDGVVDLGFRYFGFDGCHRLCCAKKLGIEAIPGFIFKAAMHELGSRNCNGSSKECLLS